MVEPEGAQLKNLRALIVIEDGEQRRRCTELLEGQGMVVGLLAGGTDLLRSIREQLPDLVVCDAGSVSAELAEKLLADFAVRHVKPIPLEAEDLDQPPERPGQRLVDRVLDSIGPRLALEAGLDDGGAVSGRVEEVGARALLLAVSRRRRDRRVTIWLERVSLVVELRGGELYSLEYTDADADPCSGRAALEKLLALDEAVFEVAPVEVDPGRQFEHDVSAEVEAAADRLSRLAAGEDPGPVAGLGSIAPAGRANRSPGLKVAMALVVLAVMGAGAFLGIRYFVFGQAVDGDHAESEPVAEVADDSDGGPGSAAVVSEAELEQLEAALRRGAATVRPPSDLDEKPEPTAAGEPDAGAQSEPARPRPIAKKKPGTKGAQKKQPAPKGQKVKQPKKKGDPDVEAMIDDLGIDFD